MRYHENQQQLDDNDNNHNNHDDKTIGLGVDTILELTGNDTINSVHKNKDKIDYDWGIPSSKCRTSGLIDESFSSKTTERCQVWPVKSDNDTSSNTRSNNNNMDWNEDDDQK